jgi:3-deoxy-D-manno-octulosonic-acid transferase
VFDFNFLMLCDQAKTPFILISADLSGPSLVGWQELVGVAC